MTPRREAVETLREAARTEAAALLQAIAAPRGMGETIGACIRRTAGKLGWPYRRTEDIWRREARRIESFEMDILRREAAERSNPDNQV